MCLSGEIVADRYLSAPAAACLVLGDTYKATVAFRAGLQVRKRVLLTAKEP